MSYLISSNYCNIFTPHYFASVTTWPCRVLKLFSLTLFLTNSQGTVSFIRHLTCVQCRWNEADLGNAPGAKVVRANCKNRRLPTTLLKPPVGYHNSKLWAHSFAKPKAKKKPSFSKQTLVKHPVRLTAVAEPATWRVCCVVFFVCFLSHWNTYKQHTLHQRCVTVWR